ncbi:MAG TPA: nicotinate phosphoribosyltransferase [Tissierellia bacterium]|jgi:nicotinate phosphoribosyltransferase|nr:nicotinate phosphoribosyltransferase [Tissierellia bacterium]
MKQKDTVRNLTMLMDLYEMTMSMGYFQSEMTKQIVYFDMFFRRTPDGGSMAIAAGLEQLIEYIENMCFDEEDIEYLRSVGIHDESFLEYVRNFRFTGDIWAVEEGTPVFPREPLVTVRANVIEAQLIETTLLVLINHQSLIATKSNRLVRASQGIPIVEFGARRAQGADAAYLGARAAYIGGCIGTSNLMAGRDFGVPVFGTMAHSWIQLFDDEYEAFKAYARSYPASTALLVDTYNTLMSGVPNAIRVFDEVVVPSGHRPLSIRLDSGDLAYLSKEARKMLDDAGYPDVKIMASNAIEEETIKALRDQDACIDIFGIGEKLITASSDAVFGGVYKLVAIEQEDGTIEPKIKISENVEKITTPHFKDLYRFYDKKSGKALADLLTIHGEEIDTSKPYELFDPVYTWKKTVVEDFEVKSLLVPIFKDGICVYPKKTIEEIRAHRETEEERLWDGVKRILHPHKYFVDFSLPLWNLKNDLLTKYSARGR